jgi:hypothetical protein
MTLLQDLDEKQIKWITNRATLRLRRLAVSRLKFHDDFDEWEGYTIPARLGGGTVDVNYFIYGSNRLWIRRQERTDSYQSVSEHEVNQSQDSPD